MWGVQSERGQRFAVGYAGIFVVVVGYRQVLVLPVAAVPAVLPQSRRIPVQRNWDRGVSGLSEPQNAPARNPHFQPLQPEHRRAASRANLSLQFKLIRTLNSQKLCNAY